MCIDIFVGSQKPLPVISFDDYRPSFYIQKVDDLENSIAKERLAMQNIYFAGSFMGCSCGLSTGSWHKKDEDYNERVRDVRLFMKYLKKHCMGNEVRVTAIDYDDLERPLRFKTMNPADILNENEFEMKPNIVFTVN